MNYANNAAVLGGAGKQSGDSGSEGGSRSAAGEGYLLTNSGHFHSAYYEGYYVKLHKL